MIGQKNPKYENLKEKMKENVDEEYLSQHAFNGAYLVLERGDFGLRFLIDAGSLGSPTDAVPFGHTPLTIATVGHVVSILFVHFFCDCWCCFRDFYLTLGYREF